MPSYLKSAQRHIFVAALAAMLTGCFMAPGTFTSELRIDPDGRFAFNYDGEIALVGLTQMAEMSERAQEERFSPEPCTADDGTVRDCSSAEIGQQREEWTAAAPNRAMERAQQAEMMRLMIGEVDLSNPAKIAEFARKLERQAGWNTVRYRADGIFDVSFAIDGMLTHDFLFPVVEGFPMPGAFVQMHVRDEDIVRVEAPGYSPSGGVGGSDMGAIPQLMGMAARSGETTGSDLAGAKLPPLDGTFRIVTGARVLANNTDEGGQASAGQTVLSWTIDPATRAAPMAMLQLTR